jgi:pre-mRNA-splicing factor SPF27
MALTTAVHDSLPYIDPEPTPAQRAAAQALIDAELQLQDSSPSTTKISSHPSLPALRPSTLTPLLTLEMERISSNAPLTSIDLTRYESPTSSNAASPPTPQTLTRAHIAQTYLHLRTQHLTLLSQFGKNAWLISNAQSEDVLRGLEMELELTKREIDNVVLERRGLQEGKRGEIEGLGMMWKRGVGRVLETESAAEGVRGEVLRGRRGCVS